MTPSTITGLLLIALPIAFKQYVALARAGSTRRLVPAVVLDVEPALLQVHAHRPVHAVQPDAVRLHPRDLAVVELGRLHRDPVAAAPDDPEDARRAPLRAGRQPDPDPAAGLLVERGLAGRVGDREAAERLGIRRERRLERAPELRHEVLHALVGRLRRRGPASSAAVPLRQADERGRAPDHRGHEAGDRDRHDPAPRAGLAVVLLVRAGTANALARGQHLENGLGGDRDHRGPVLDSHGRAIAVGSGLAILRRLTVACRLAIARRIAVDGGRRRRPGRHRPPPRRRPSTCLDSSASFSASGPMSASASASCGGASPFPGSSTSLLAVQLPSSSSAWSTAPRSSPRWAPSSSASRSIAAARRRATS